MKSIFFALLVSTLCQAKTPNHVAKDPDILYDEEVDRTAENFASTEVFVNDEAGLSILLRSGPNGEASTTEIENGKAKDFSMMERIRKLKRLDRFWESQLKFFKENPKIWQSGGADRDKWLPKKIKTEEAFLGFVKGIERARAKLSKQLKVLEDFYEN